MFEPKLKKNIKSSHDWDVLLYNGAQVRKWVFAFLEHVSTIIVILFFIIPIAWIVITAFKPTEVVYSLSVIFEPTLENFKGLFSSSLNFYPFILNSISVTTLTIAIAIPFGLLTAYSLSRFQFPGKPLILFLIMGTQFVPPVVIVIQFFILFRDIGILDTNIALIWVNIGIMTPFAVWLIKGFIDSIPIEIEEAALIDGCSRFTIIRKVIFPLARSGIITATVFCFVLTWNEFLFSLILSRENAVTLPVGLMLLNSEKGVLWGLMSAAGILIMLPTTILMFLVRKNLIKGLTLGAVK
ncbi:carbohydrate ABC transporter permease [Peribacillus muralis]|uniref:carbohydrate ABC transporter permease n=1 Tax=Peribacillus muralis TaxID=264697 RepID=UPI00366F3312